MLKATDGQYPPTLIYTGATASVKSNSLMSSFSTGKYALRALSQSIGKEFGPKGIHVAHAIIDGVIDIERTKEWLKDAGPDAKINAASVSRTTRVSGVYTDGSRLRTPTGTFILNRSRRSQTRLTFVRRRKSGRLAYRVAISELGRNKYRSTFLYQC